MTYRAEEEYPILVDYVKNTYRLSAEQADKLIEKIVKAYQQKFHERDEIQAFLEVAEVFDDMKQAYELDCFGRQSMEFIL